MVTKPDKEGTPVGTGVAYVRFTSPTEADRARKERHRQQMGVRYIECLPFTASHYTSPAALPAQMGALAPMGSPYPMAMSGRYPGPPPAQRQFPSMSALGQALPTQEVRSPSCHHASSPHASLRPCCEKHESWVRPLLHQPGSHTLHDGCACLRAYLHCVQDLGARGGPLGGAGRPPQWQASQPGMAPPPLPLPGLGAQQAGLRLGRAQPQPQVGRSPSLYLQCMRLTGTLHASMPV